MPGFSTIMPLPLEQPPLIMLVTVADVWQALFLIRIAMSSVQYAFRTSFRAGQGGAFPTDGCPQKLCDDLQLLHANST
ncbi:hypothetical protein BU25DRAFT_405407 [Macroventuria anomochaeta]|uniref:Uncharacterized protein n=1 Tax=Macroventuria anomochaeta TaxID=301207 RepID=A0ACB6SHR9_9PLEO|nr:uncharacterized protein BU25DRAFT_405407 [Macroventuria anomochaeta]KAF2633528.1 hypothetical protein BU25DRAFT_405407 [Macroventuria anomochaeta]